MNADKRIANQCSYYKKDLRQGITNWSKVKKKGGSLGSSSASEKIGDMLTESVSSVRVALKATHVLLVLCGTLLAGAAGVFAGAPLSWPPSIAQVLVVIGALLAFAGGILAVFVERDPREAMDQARREAVLAEGAKQLAQQRLDYLEKYEDALDKLKSLYLTVNSSRGVIERAITSGLIHEGQLNDPEAELITSVLEDAGHDLRVSFGFETKDFWTIVVYRTSTDQDTNSPILTCIAHLRSISCDLSKARKWRLGVGIAGMALARNTEIVAPDLEADNVGSAFRLNGDSKRQTDSEHYKSMFAVPISVGDDSTPWGVVVATSSKNTHFGSANPEGLAPEETARALAGICALIVAVGREDKETKNVQGSS